MLRALEAKVVFRVDASYEIGIGHLMRCLTIADELSRRGTSILFICRDLKGNLADYICQRGYDVSLLRRPAVEYVASTDDVPHAAWLGVDWRQDVKDTVKAFSSAVDFLFVDHYGIDKRWQRQMREYAKSLVVIDDLADREHDCDFLLDQTYGRVRNDYMHLVTEDCRLLLGSGYCLVRPEFSRLRAQALEKRRKPQGGYRILVFMGGMDSNNLTDLVLEGLNKITFNESITVDVILGRNAPHRKKVEESAQNHSLPVKVYLDVTNMAEFMACADLAIGSPGTASWERCCLGLPTLLIVGASNQEIIAEKMHSVNAAKNLGWYNHISADELAREIRSMLQFDSLCKMSASAAVLCDGRGVTRLLQNLFPRISKEGQKIYLRPATQADAQIMFLWQNNPRVRKYSRNKTAPSWENHLLWLEHKMNEPRCVFNIIEYAGKPAGVVRLDPLTCCPDADFEISILVDPDQFGKGIAQESLELIKELVPNSKILAEVDPDNSASKKLFENAGYLKNDVRTYLLQ